jgi:hypothetical protein
VGRKMQLHILFYVLIAVNREDITITMYMTNPSGEKKTVLIRGNNEMNA